jgi:hypothetical protein
MASGKQTKFFPSGNKKHKKKKAKKGKLVHASPLNSESQ